MMGSTITTTTASKPSDNFTASPNPSAYERMTGNSTRRLAQSMIYLATSQSSLQHTSYTAHPITSSSHILDNACGPGIVLSSLKSLHPNIPFGIVATDLSPSMLEEVNTLVSRDPSLWSIHPGGGVQTLIQDVRHLDKLESSTFSHVFTSLGLYVPGDEDTGALAACREMYRVLQPLASVAVVSTWADRVFVPAYARAFRRTRPATEQPSNKLTISPRHNSGTYLFELMEKAGFGGNVVVVPINTYIDANSMDELVENMGLARRMVWTDCDKWSDEEMRVTMEALREELRGLRTFEEDEGTGKVKLGMKAWVALGWRDGQEGVEAC